MSLPCNIAALTLLFHIAVDAARSAAARLAQETDDPPPGVVEAADAIEQAADRLAQQEAA